VSTLLRYVSPDCFSDKHRACVGEAWSDDDDTTVTCQCTCHGNPDMSISCAEENCLNCGGLVWDMDNHCAECTCGCHAERSFTPRHGVYTLPRLFDTRDPCT
jgi:hypothetical protein